jgi:catechol 2,3-dioxygenase-like lactoylglutathione lyase family enzyme
MLEHEQSSAGGQPMSQANDGTDASATTETTRRTGRRDFLKRAAIVGAGAGTLGSLALGKANATERLAQGKEGNRCKPLPGEASLGGNIAKVLFLTINVSDLDRAMDFYEATYPVKRAEVVDPPLQPFNGFGIPKGRFRGRMMRDSQPFQGSAILLVEWISPRPVGTPYAEANHLGWYREHANASLTGQTARYEAALKHGGRPYGPPSLIYITPTEQIYSFGFRDPDGTTLEWVGPLDPTPGGPPDTIGGPNNNCRDLHRSYDWYANVLGLEMQVRLDPLRLQPQSAGSLGDVLRRPNGTVYKGKYDYDAAIMIPRPDDRNSVDLLQWTVPGTYGRAYASANNLGMMNLTYQVNDVQVVYEKLLRLLPDPRRYIVAPPETWDLGSFGIKKTLNVLDPDGVRFQFMEETHSTDPTP